MTETNKILKDAKNLEGKKVLYFEGAGCDFEQSELNGSDVLNYRIRTSFLNNDGVEIYLEMGNAYMRDKKGKNTEKMGIRIDHLLDVKRHEEQNNGYEVKPIINGETVTFDWKVLHNTPYTCENITKWINENLNCSFDTIHVLNRFYGYYVHDKGGKQLMENIELDHITASKKLDAYNEYFEWYKTYRKFPCLSVIESAKEYIKVKTHDSDKMIAENGIEREMTILI